MKKILFPIIALILIACSPQVTQSPTVTSPPPTQTPIPTPTLHPDFVALQNLISDSSNLVLLPDGTIENNGVVIPNLNVDQNGVINIIFNNERVVIETSQISFDDENGLTIKGYELNENGEWVEAQETVKLDNGAILTLEDKNGDGISEVTEVRVDNDDLSEEQREMLVNQLNPGYVGFAPDEAKLYFDAESQNYWVGSADDPSNVIARADETTGRLIWDFDKMKDENGESILFRIAHTWEMNGVMPVDMEAAQIDSQSLQEKMSSTFTKGVDYSGMSIGRTYIYNTSGNTAIGSAVLITGRRTSAEALIAERIDVTGEVFFLDKAGNLVVINVENLDCTTRFWK